MKLISQRVLAAASGAVFAVGMVVSLLAHPQAGNQAPQAGAPAQGAPQGGGPQGRGAAGQGRGGRGGPGQGGSGALKVLFVSKGHPFDREGLFATLDALGTDITWTHVEHPAAEAFLEPKLAAPYDVLLFYDMDGYGPRQHTVTNPDGTQSRTWDPPSAELQKNFKALLQSGKGLVFFHHSIASWVHSWPEYTEVVGGACDWGNPITIRGVEHPRSGFFQKTAQKVTIVDKSHPITQGLTDGFEITDESYSCPFFEESVHPLVRTDFVPADHDRNLNPKWKYSNLAAWVKTAENSPVAYVQFGHDRTAWENPQFRVLLLNAMKWAGSPEAKAWAKANPKKIFK